MNRITADLGLRHRLRRAARRVTDQHHTIANLYKALSEEISEGSKCEVRAGFDRYRGALTAHFDLEEQIFFPAVRSLDPCRNEPIRKLIEGHSRMRAELAHTADSIDSLPSDEFLRRLLGFATILSSHERKEETLLADVIEFESTDRESAVPEP